LTLRTCETALVRSPRLAVAMLVVSGITFGTAGTARALGPDSATSLGVAAVRIGLGALILLALLRPLGGRYSELSPLLRRPAVWLAAVFVVLFQTLYFVGVTLDGVVLGALLTMGSLPVFSGLLGAFFGHRVHRTWIVSTIICTAGLVFLSVDGIEGGSALGVAAALGSGLAGAVYTVLIKRMLDDGTSEIPLSVAAYLIAGVIFLPLLLLQSPTWLLTPQGAAMAVYLGVVAMALPNILWVKALTTLPPGPTSTLMLTDPAVATILGVVLLGERLAVIGVFGLGLVIVGLVMQGRALARSESTVDVPRTGV
jgi:DME family drug/metabolite transporter